jgi:hypothetical protein
MLASVWLLRCSIPCPDILPGNPQRRGGSMNIERCEDLIDWTHQAHARLADCMAEAADERSDSLAKMLLDYLVQHERELIGTIARIKEHADPQALQTRLHDAVRGELLVFELDSEAYGQMSVDEISREIFGIHNQIIDLYRSLESRPGLGRAGELIGEMLQLEEQETMRLAQQVNRMHEL